MKDFFHYFFGKGGQVEFTNFSLAHFLPILLATAVIVVEMSYFWQLVGVVSLMFFLSYLPWLTKDQEAKKSTVA